MKYKLLALDMDDSLLSEDLSISPKNIEALHAIEDMGTKIMLCSGRPLASMVKYLDVLGFHNQDDYIVSFNGALIHKLSGEEIFNQRISGPILESLIDIGRKNNLDVQLYNDEMTVERYTEKTRIYELLTGLETKIIDDLKTVKESVKVLYNHVAGPELENHRLELIEKFGDELNIFYSKPNYVEVLNKKSSKGLAIEYLAKKLGIDRSEVVAMGDGFNDVSMLQFAGVGIAVANAADGVKANANYVTKATHNEDALWEVYEKYFLGNK